MNLNLDYSKIHLNEQLNNDLIEKINNIHNKLHNEDLSFGTEWVDYPINYDKNYIQKIKNLASTIKNNASVLLVVGVGGSYLGAKMGIDIFKNKTNSQVIFAGTNFDYENIFDILEDIKQKDIFVNVVSKSGTTVETLVAFNIIENFLKEKYGDNYKKRIIVTTDYNDNYLLNYAKSNDIETLPIPIFMGGRYSVLSAVGLLPFAVAGIDIDEVLNGAKQAYMDLNNSNIESNFAYQYALYRYFLNTKLNKKMEVFCSFSSKLSSFGQWLQQLFCESEGKDGKGLFVSSLTYSTDLHSVGQFIQDGSPCLAETFISVKNVKNDYTLKNIANDSPIKYLNNKTMSYINKSAYLGALQAHIDANVPIAIIEVDEMNEFNFGYLIYFFEMACAVSAMLLDVNPFNQPSVEHYKKYMKNLLLND